MAEKAQRSGVGLRPHFKTHQSLEVGRWFKAVGISKITVSSFEMAEYFSTEWCDITVAFPANILEIETINRLASKIQLNVLIESIETAAFLEQYLAHDVGCFLKIDLGAHRTGLNPENTEAMDNLMEYTHKAEKLELKGFLGHAGHSYHAKDITEITTIHQQSVSLMSSLKKRYKNPGVIVSIGDTPTCSLMDDFRDVDEIRPGNFVFYDLMQHYIGSNKAEQIAVALACPVVAIHKQRNEAVIYGGGIHFSKERIEHPKYGPVYGQVVENKGSAWGAIIPDMFLKGLSQEHGIVSIRGERINDLSVGDVLMVLPVHSCMAANLMKEYYVAESGDKITTMNSC